MQLNKYTIIEAETLEARKRHRQLIEDLLVIQELSPEDRAIAEHELQKAIVMEKLAKDAVDEIEQESDDDKDSGSQGKDGSGSGAAGGDSSGEDGGRGSGGGDGGGGGPSLETLALLFFLTEHAVEDRKVAPDQGGSLNIIDEPEGAATLAFDSIDNIAHVHEPLGAAIGEDKQSKFIPIIEHYAAEKGARMLVLKVHKHAVEFYEKRLGYELHRASYKKNNAVQIMRKKLFHKFKIEGLDCA